MGMSQIDAAQTIMEVRKRLGVSQTAFADVMGLDQSTISRMERGALPVSKRTQQTLALLIERLKPEKPT